MHLKFSNGAFVKDGISKTLLLIENELYLCSNCQEKITAHWELLIAPERENKAIDLIYLMFLVAKENTTNTLFVYFSIKTVTMDISDIYQNIFAETLDTTKPWKITD